MEAIRPCPLFPALQAAMRVAGARERMGCSDLDPEFAAQGKIEELCKTVLQTPRGQQTRQREAGQ